MRVFDHELIRMTGLAVECCDSEYSCLDSNERSVVSGQSGEPRTGVRGWALSVARAFQPEHCPSAIDLRTGAGELQAVCLTRSREAAKGNAMGSLRSGERWLVLFVARAFQPEHCPGDF